MTFAHDHEETYKQLYGAAYQFLLHIHGESDPAAVSAASAVIAARALKAFGEKMPKQIEAMMAKVLTDALLAGYAEHISDQIKIGLPPRKAREAQAQLRELNLKMSTAKHQQVWGAPRRGRPSSFNDDDLRAAFDALGASATQEAVAEHLGVSADRMKQYRESGPFNTWEDLRRYFTGGTNVF